MVQSGDWVRTSELETKIAAMKRRGYVRTGARPLHANCRPTCECRFVCESCGGRLTPYTAHHDDNCARAKAKGAA